MRLEFYRGIKEIAQFLDMNPRTVRKRIAAGKLPVKMDGAGKWVLTNIDFYTSLVVDSPEKNKGE